LKSFLRATLAILAEKSLLFFRFVNEKERERERKREKKREK
jgi:hypothetical protein